MGDKHIYKSVDGRELSLYVVKPDGWSTSDNRPAVVFYHGGGWIGGRPTQFDEHSKYLASRGMVCIQVEYRLLKSKTKESPAVCIRDAKSSMRWVRANAGALGIDPERIASGGGSAGGHLAAFVGMMDGVDDPADDLGVSARSNAMLLFNPVFDNGPGGFGYARVGEEYRDYSPFHNISSDDPPAIVFLGDKDNLVPVKTAAKFKEKMVAVGVKCKVLILEGMPHGFFNYGRNENIPYYKTILACDEFLVELGWLKGPPALDVAGVDLEKVPSYYLGTSRLDAGEKSSVKITNQEEMQDFESAADCEWRECFRDPCTGDWRENWFLDGEVGKATNGEAGMTLTAGPEFKNDAHHMVLWTKESFEGDLKIEYDYTRLDDETRCVNIIYIQATGSGEQEFNEDITKWNDRRRVPAMRTYFNNMDTYHISYAAFDNSGKSTTSYIRARRYIPHKNGLRGTALSPEYESDTLFAPGEKHHITIIKKARDIFMRVENPESEVYYHFNNAELPVVTAGRIGLRHMFTRSSCYKNFSVSKPR